MRCFAAFAARCPDADVSLESGRPRPISPSAKRPHELDRIETGEHGHAGPRTALQLTKQQVHVGYRFRVIQVRRARFSRRSRTPPSSVRYVRTELKPLTRINSKSAFFARRLSPRVFSASLTMAPKSAAFISSVFRPRPPITSTVFSGSGRKRNRCLIGAGIS